MRHVLVMTCNLFCYIAQRFSVFTVMYLKLSWYMYYISIHVCNCPICKEFRARLSYYSYRTLKCVHALCTFWQCTKCWYTCTMYFTKYFAYMHVKILPLFFLISLLLAQLHKLSYIKNAYCIYILLNTTVNCYATKQIKKLIWKWKKYFKNAFLYL